MLGAAARVFNLGTFSLWLDEILLVRRASGSLAEVWRACQANADLWYYFVLYLLKIYIR